MLRKNTIIRFVCCACTLTMLILFTGCELGPMLLRGKVNTLELYSNYGYYFAEYEGESPKGESFLACGSDGRLDRIYADGTVEKIALAGVDKHLTQILVGQDITLIGGQSGTLLYSQDGQGFTVNQQVTESDIVGLALFKGQYYVGARDGSVFVSDDGVSWQKRAQLSNSSILSLTATEDYIAAISADTDIFMSPDGENWGVQHYNQTSDKRMVFTKLISLSPSFYILGYYENDPDWPLIMYSDNGGEKWRYKTLDEINGQEPEEFAPLTVNHISLFAGELMGVCNNGRVLTITECSVCNAISDASESDLHGVALSENNMLVVGDNFEFSVLNALDFRQDKIKAKQAQTDFLYNGAVIIDVRTDEEYEESHIAGTLHIPVDEIETRLPAEVPDKDTEIIFYCAAGKRAQTALETAQKLGYMNVFNLGGLDDWPYKKEP